jgi:hypothetical protein
MNELYFRYDIDIYILYHFNIMECYLTYEMSYLLNEEITPGFKSDRFDWAGCLDKMTFIVPDALNETGYVF